MQSWSIIFVKASILLYHRFPSKTFVRACRGPIWCPLSSDENAWSDLRGEKEKINRRLGTVTSSCLPLKLNHSNLRLGVSLAMAARRAGSSGLAHRGWLIGALNSQPRPRSSLIRSRVVLRYESSFCLLRWLGLFLCVMQIVFPQLLLCLRRPFFPLRVY